MKFQTNALLPLLVLVALPLRAQFTDTFSTSSSSDASNYTEFLAYLASGSSGPTPTFSINSSNQFQPTGGVTETTIFLRKGVALSDSIFNQSVSLSLVNVDSVGGADSIGFSDSATPPNETAGGGYSSQAFEFGIVAVGGNYYISETNIASLTNGVTSINTTNGSDKLDVNFADGSITETITRKADNTFDYEFSGPGLLGTYNGATLTLTDEFSGTFTVTGSIATGKALYFGPDIYGGSSSSTAGQQIEDNLQYVPEPSAYALLATGAGFLLFMARRVAKRS